MTGLLFMGASATLPKERLSLSSPAFWRLPAPLSSNAPSLGNETREPGPLGFPEYRITIEEPRPVDPVLPDTLVDLVPEETSVPGPTDVVDAPLVSPAPAGDDSIVADSTARATFLSRPTRRYPIASPFPSRTSPFFLTPGKNGGVQRIVTIDTARNMVIIREQVGGKDVSIPYQLPLDEYIQLRYESERQRRTAEHVNRTGQGKAGDLEGLIKNITEFDIPVPPNPLMSIFGDRSRISLRISGAIDINAGFRIEQSDQQSVFLRPTQFSPNFKQQVQISVNGLIGDKLSIRADWSTERTFDYENQIKIKYTGYEDEIVQSVELGNVSLQTPSALVGGSGALFGIKAEFQTGPFRLTTLLSQKKGESSRMSINGGAQEQKFERHAYEYSDNHYFIDVAYRDPISPGNSRNVYEAYYNYRDPLYASQVPVKLRPELQIKDLEVWVTRPAATGNIPDPEERDAVALITNPDFYNPGDAQYPPSFAQYLDPGITVDPISGAREVGKFKKWKRDIDFTYNDVTGILTLNQNVQEDQVVAVAYRVQGPTAVEPDDQIFGTFSSDPRLKTYPDPQKPETQIPSRLVLKLVKPKNLGPSFPLAWKQKVKTIYSLNMRNVKKEDIANFKVVFRNGAQPDEEILPNTSVNLLKLFGLDYTDDNGGPPDNKIDFLPGITVDPVRGEIIFPTLEPWDDGLVRLYTNIPNKNAADVLPYTYPQVYDTTKTIARQSDRDKILIAGVTRGTSSATYNLGFNVVPGSVRVYLGGQPLRPGTDYTVDENVGQVRLLKEEALVPGAKVDIDFERQDLFSFASKTLIGARGELTLGKESFIGFTLLSLNQKTLSDKVRIGEEPINNTMFGIDARTRMDLPMITDALNTLPFIQTKEKSSLTLAAEAAVMMPDPNTKTSTIAGDKGAGIAYIDDFEGSRMFIPLQTAYSVWKLASVPDSLPTLSAPDRNGMQSHRAKLDWYNVPITALSSRSVVVTDIWPDRKAAREDQRITVLDLDYTPTARGQFNYTPTLSDPQRNWAGVMRLLPTQATNLVDGNYNYLEIWMKVDKGLRGKMLIDIGKISEDVIPNNVLNTEDAVVFGMNGRNGILNPGEDVGLDMLTNAEEQTTYATEVATYNLGSDPSGDNFAYDPNNWVQFNGTEGNVNDPAGVFPDTEDLNNNGILDLTNEYFQYEIDLDTTRFSPTLDPTLRNPLISGGGANGWYQFRIPLVEFTRKFGNPALENVEFIRVMLTGAEQPLLIRVADFNFVGNQWLERQRNDPQFTVSVVNVEDNPEYSTPPGVIRPRDRTRPDQEVYGNEQSLALVFRNLPDTTYREAFRIFPGTGLDLFNYEYLKLFVHGEKDKQYNADFVVRIGIDTANFYEYRQPLNRDWQDVSIRFSDLTAIKAQRDSAHIDLDNIPVPGGPTDSYFRVRGRPDIIRVQYISVGIRNVGNQGFSISGQAWVNELRVVSPKTQKGYAYTGSMNLRLADVADVSANVSYSDPYFHSLSERFSTSRSNTSSWNLSTTLNIDKVFPKEWQGTQIRVSYAHSESYTKPLLLPGQPDVEVDAAVNAMGARAAREGKSQREVETIKEQTRVASQTLEVRDSWAIPTIRLKVPSENWLVKDVVNRIELSYNYSIIRYRDPVFQSRRNWQWQARVGYGYDFSKDYYVQPFKSLFKDIFLLDDYRDVKFYFLPTRIGGNADLTRSRIEEKQRNLPDYNPFVRNFAHSRSLSLNYTATENGFLNLSGSYNANMQTTLLNLETEPMFDDNGDPLIDPTGTPVVRQRQSSAIFSDIFFGRGFLYFGVPTRYTQQVSVSTRPALPRLFDIDKFVDLSGSYQVSYNWQSNVQQGELGRSAGYNATVNGQLNFKVKGLFDPLFPPDKDDGQKTGMPGGITPKTPSKGPSRLEQLRARYIAKEQELQTVLKDKATATPERINAMTEELSRLRLEIEKLQKEGEAPVVIADSTSAGPSRNLLADVANNLVRYVIREPFLQYESVGLTFTQNTASSVSGVRGETGFTSFWSNTPFSAPIDADQGPSRWYQLGLISDPNPMSGSLGFTNRFPFVEIRNYRRGLRAPNPNGTYVDNYTQSNTVSMRTGRALWEGARLDLTWDLKWSYNKNYQILTDTLGYQTITGVTTTGQLERSYLMLPDFLFFSFFNTTIGAVNERFTQLSNDATDTRTPSEKLGEAFSSGLEAAPWLSKILGEFMPRVNWGFRWDGLEKISFLEGVADRISFEHRYTSSTASTYRISPDNGNRITETKRAQYNFAPLAGLTFQFNKLWGGNMSVNARWGTQKSYDLNLSATNIVETGSDEYALTANFRKSGFEMPFLGLTLKNDVDFSFSFSLNRSSSRTYDVNNLGSGGQPREGTMRITIEPRVRYNISQRVTSSVFYRYSRTKPDESVGSRVPGTTIHEGGLEIRITISGS